MPDSNSPQVGIRISSDPDTTRIEQPQTAGAKERVDLPLRLLFVADLAPHAAPDWTAGSRVVSVDPYSFGDLFRSLAPRLTLEVPNRMSDAPKVLDVELDFDGLKAFQPERVAQQVPALAQLAGIRDLIDQVGQKQIGLDAFKDELDGLGVEPDYAGRLYDALSAPPSAAKPKPKAAPKRTSSEDASLDRLFGMISTGDDDEETDESGDEPAADPSSPAGLADALVGALAGASPSSGPKVEQTAAATLRADLDAVLAQQMQAILTHPAFRRLEAAWRGLKLLVDRLDFRSGIRLDVLAASKSQLHEAVYHQVLMPEHGAEGDDHVPLVALILDHTFDNSSADIDLLTDLAETGASLQVPCIAGVDAAFFDLGASTGLAKLPVVWQHLNGPAFIPYQKLRQRPETRHLALAVPPVVLRSAYEPTEKAPYSEPEPLWGSGALAVAAMIGQSFAHTGWPTHLVSTAEHRLEGLPTWASPGGQTPLGALLPERKLGELADAGFTVLSGRPDRDVVYVARTAMVFHPDHLDSDDANAEAAAHASLPTQLFLARATQFLLRFEADLPEGIDAVEAQVELHQRLRALLQGHGPADLPEDAIHIQYLPEASTDAVDVLAVRLRPPSSVLEHPVSLMMGVRVPKAAS